MLLFRVGGLDIRSVMLHEVLFMQLPSAAGTSYSGWLQHVSLHDLDMLLYCGWRLPPKPPFPPVQHLCDKIWSELADIEHSLFEIADLVVTRSKSKHS